MKRSVLVLCITASLVLTVSCTKDTDVAKRDIEFLFNTIEQVWTVTVDYTRKGQADAGLDISEKYVMDRQKELEAAGKRMSDFMFHDEVRQFYAERFQKYRAATDKYEDYLTGHLSVGQMGRFNRITAELIGEKYMKSIEWTTDPVKFFEKGLKAKLGLP